MSNDEKLKTDVLEIRKWLYGDKAPEYEEYTTWYEPRIDHMSTLFDYIDLLESKTKQARAEAIQEIKQSVLEVIEERTSAGLDDMEGADYKEFLQAEFFVMAMGIVKDEVIKVLTKLSEGK